jgi:signal transduction histidine kinase
MNIFRKILFYICMPLAGSILISCGESNHELNSKTSAYMYEDTKQLVEFVENAAGQYEKMGDSSFTEFGRKGSKWFNDKWYLFAYDMNGVCIFHPVTPQLVGKNMFEMKDFNGKPVIRRIVEVGMKPEKDAHEWVFYHWVDRTQFDPMWKSSYVRKAVGPNKRVIAIGSGLNNLKIEKAFVKENVDRAVEYIMQNGKDKAFEVFSNPASQFCFYDTYITVIDSSGITLVDPAFPGLFQRDMKSFRDAVGREVVGDILNKLRTENEVWLQFLWPKPGESLPSRKLLYSRKITVGGRDFFVISDFFLATPIWMRL